MGALPISVGRIIVWYFKTYNRLDNFPPEKVGQQFLGPIFSHMNNFRLKKSELSSYSIVGVLTFKRNCAVLAVFHSGLVVSQPPRMSRFHGERLQVESPLGK